MYIRLIFGIILLLFSCKDPPVLPNDEDHPLVIDTDSPRIEWISPRFDEVVKGMVVIVCQIEDSSGIDSAVLYIDNSLYVIGSNSGNTFYEFIWNTTSYEDGPHILFVMAKDTAGNDTTTTSIRVKIDNSNLFPSPVILESVTEIIEIDTTIIDSVQTTIDTTIIGYKVIWGEYMGNNYQHYILERSQTSLMESSSELFIISDIQITSYIDNTVNPQIENWYYRMTIEDQFDYRTTGNVLSTSMDAMPPQWEIKSVEYNSNQLIISWDKQYYEDYAFHQVLVSDDREGPFTPIIENETILDSTQEYYEINNFDYSLRQNNWFAVITADTSGKESISPSYKHPPPQVPAIDSVLYNDNSFRLQWIADYSFDFFNYRILFSEDEDPFTLSELVQIIDSAEDTMMYPIDESEYYLYQVITTDTWGLETRSPVVTASSFHKFSTTVDNGTNDVLYSVATTDDGRYFAVGETYNSGSWLIEIDKSGAIEGSNNYGGSNSGFRCIAHTSDEGYLLTGDKEENLLVAKIDDMGFTEWSKNYEFDNNNGGNAIVQLTDGAIGVTGYSYFDGEQDLFVVKIDANGNKIWSKAIGGDKRDEGHDILPVDGGGMVILGETHSQGDIAGDIWILELDADGNILDTLLIHSTGKQIGYSFVRTNSGGYIIGGITSSENISVTDALIVKVNNLGDVDWRFSYGGTYNDLGFSLIYSDGGWILAGQTYSYDVGGGDAWLLKVNEMGEFEWMQTYGGTNPDSAFDIDLASDYGFIICGSTYIKGEQSDGWLIKTDSKGNVRGFSSYP